MRTGRPILAALIIASANAGTQAFDWRQILLPRIDTFSNTHLYLLTASIDVGTPILGSDMGPAANLAISPFHLQYTPEFAHGYAGLDGSVGYGWTLAEPDGSMFGTWTSPDLEPRGIEFDAGIHILQAFTFGVGFRKLEDGGWDRRLRIAFGIGWTGPVRLMEASPAPR